MTTKGLRMVTWEIYFRDKNGLDRPHGYYMTKKELKKFLREFNVKDYPLYDIKSLKIVRSKRVQTTTCWKDELIGFTDVLSTGTVAYIEL